MKIFGINVGGKSNTPKPKPTKASKPKKKIYPVAQATHKYDMLGHRVADLASEQGLGTYRETGDSASRYDRQTLVNLYREVMDENIILSSISDRMATNLVGADGFALQARTGDKATDEYIEKVIWPRFTQNPEYRELFTWSDVQKGVCKEMIGVGDVGFLKIKPTRQLQAIESEWINSPTGAQMRSIGTDRKVEQGIEMTLGGKVLAYWHNPPTQYGYPSGNAERMDRKNFIYVHGDIQRFSRTRPLPPFIQVMSCIWRLDDILDSEALCWQLLARLAFIINKDGSDEDAYDDSDEREDYESPEITDRIQDIGTGLIMHGSEGDKVEGVNRNLPGKDFPASLRAFMQLFAMRYGLPLEVLMLDWSKTNFSSGRAALTQAGLTIHDWQMSQVRQFHRPVYEWILRLAIEDGEIDYSPTIFDHEWFPPAPPWVDAKEEAESWGIRVDRGLVTFSDALKHQGKDRSEENERRREDIEEAIKLSNDIEEQTGVKVDWKYFAGYQVGKTENAVGAANSEETKMPDDEANEPKESEGEQ